MAYSRDQIEKMLATFDDWRVRESAVITSLFAYNFVDSAAREMMQHGFSRRVADLTHCLERVFEILPPDAKEPERDRLSDSTAFLQAFVINTFGAIDNLAWVWTLESCAVNGRKLPDRRYIGLTPANVTVRASLSDATQAYLKGTDPWFEYLEDYRHALAHRIPLYIPPRRLNGAEAAEWERLQAKMLGTEWSWEQWHEVHAAQRKLGVFEPVMMHSYGERARPVRFHGQMICDLATVIEIAEHVVRELQELQCPPPENVAC